MRICVPPTLTFLWASFSTSTTWLGAAWATFFPHKTAQEQQEESGLSSSANQCCSCSLPFLNVLKPSQVIEWRETQPTVEVPVLTENNLKHTLVDRTSQVLPLQTPTSVTAGRTTHYGAGETYQEDGDQLTNLCRLAGSQARLGEDLVETLTCKKD